jgi:hypothetical protein
MNQIKNIFSVFLWIQFSGILLSNTHAQTNNFPFEVVLKADSITGFNGLHSFAYGQRDGKLLLIGGRPEGIHARLPSESEQPALASFGFEHEAILVQAFGGVVCGLARTTAKYQHEFLSGWQCVDYCGWLCL